MATPLLTREELLARLCETFRRYGYEGASVSRIATATGLGKASLYHYFPGGKAEMAQAVLESLGQWFERSIFAPLQAVCPPRQRIISMLATLADQYASGQKACLPGLFAQTEERDMFQPLIREFFARWIDCLAQTLTDSGLGRDVARRRAHDAVERIQGALVLSRAFGDNGAFTTMAAELPDQLLAGADRSTLWTMRAPRLPAAPHIPGAPKRAV